VEQALPKLREMLADNGITLGNTTVSDQLPENRHGGTENRQQNRGAWSVSADGAPLAGASQNGLTVLPGRRHEGMVDIFA
jgi:flagellar hook-length control protein FliK